LRLRFRMCSIPLVSLRTVMGDFSDSEQGCDFFLGEIRHYDGSEDLILAAYTDQAVRGYPVQVIFLNDGQIPDSVSGSMPEPLNDLAGWELPPSVDQQALYMIYFVVLSYDGDIHLNCR